MDNEIRYDEILRSTFLNVWNSVLPDEPLFHPDAYLPFWYLQSDNFWHIVPIRQAVLRAMEYFRVPANIRDIARTISRTAWGGTIKEDDVELILTTMSEIISIRGKYVLRN